MARLTANQAGILSEQQLRLRAAAQTRLDPLTNTLLPAMAVAAMISDVAAEAERRMFTGDAKHLRKAAELLQAKFLNDQPWQTIARYAAGKISALLIKNGFSQLDHGYIDIKGIPGPSSWEIREATGAPEAPVSVPTPPPGSEYVGQVTPVPQRINTKNIFQPFQAPTQPPNPPATPTPISEGNIRPKTVDMADELTGVDDPLSSGGSDFSLGQDPRLNLWDDIKQGAGWAWENIGKPVLQGQGGQQQPTGAPGVPPPPPGVNLNGGMTAQQAYEAALAASQAGIQYFTDPNGNGNGGDGGVPLPFPLPQIGNLYDYFQGSQMPDVNGLMLPAVTAPAATARLKAPKGYVIVTIQPNDPLWATAAQAGGVQQPDGSIKVAMDKDKARKRKYWKPRPKPWLTAADKRVLTHANRVEKKVAKAYLKAGIGPKDIKEAKNC